MSPIRKTAYAKTCRRSACAKMFSIPELFAMICIKMDRSSLVRCAQLNREWNMTASRFIWRTIPKDMPAHRWYQFRHLVLEDYLQEIREQDKQQLRQLEVLQRSAMKLRRPLQALRPQKPVKQPLETYKPLALDKHREYVQRVEDFAQFLRGLEPAFASSSDFSSSDYLGPSAMTLARHFLRRCPNVLLHFQITHEQTLSPKWLECASEILPKVDSLIIKGGNNMASFTVAEFQQILCTVSNNLRSLTVDVPLFNTRTNNSDIGLISGGYPGLPVQPITARLKTLKLHALGERGERIMGWSWIWRACNQVTDIEIHCLSENVLDGLVSSLPDSMPSLETVKFGASMCLDGWRNRDPLENSIASILAANSNGWKAVRCCSPVKLGPQALEALLHHASTLEDVSLGTACDTPRVLQVLKTCPKLRMFADLDNVRYCHVPLPVVHLAEFVDFASEIDPVRLPWLSSASLEILSIALDCDPAQLPWDREDIARRLCERLGRFTNLRILHLGQGNCKHEGLHISYGLELTLHTGLSALVDLKNLQELHICKLGCFGLGVEEVKWMMKHWPRLSKICGLGRRTNAYKWLRRNRPKINLG